MKKLLIACCMFLGMQTVSAQEASWIPKNIGVGVGVGTTGIVIDASTTIHNYFGVRFGVDIMPKFKVDTNLKLSVGGNTSIEQLKAKYPQLATLNIPNEVEVEGKLNNTTWHFLVDVYPFGAASSFHATVGAYFGPSDVITIYNNSNSYEAVENINLWNKYVYGNNLGQDKMIGAELGDYFITPNPEDHGYVEASVKVKKFRPYLGLGFGRAVPKNRIGCQFDMGVQFWGSPEVIAPQYKDGQFFSGKLDHANVSSDAGGFVKTISKIKVYPVLNFRLVGRIL